MTGQSKLKPSRPEWWARGVRCPNAQTKAVLMIIASMVDRRGACHPSQPELARFACTSEASVWRALKWLEDQALISREARFKKSPHRKSDRIYLNWQTEVPEALQLVSLKSWDTRTNSSHRNDQLVRVKEATRQGDEESKPLKQAI